MIAIGNVHANADVFPNPERFDPYRFVGTRTPTAWVPFGGGTRRCIGAAFANVEMDVVLRTVLRHFVIETDNAPDEKIHFRGIAFTPKDGGRDRGAPPRVRRLARFVSMSLVDMMNGAMEFTIPTAHKMGIKAVEAGAAIAAASVPLEGNGNHFGVVYAGVEFTVAEMLGGIIAIASFDAAKYYPLVKNVDIEFTAHGPHRPAGRDQPRRG